MPSSVVPTLAFMADVYRLSRGGAESPRFRAYTAAGLTGAPDPLVAEALEVGVDEGIGTPIRRSVHHSPRRARSACHSEPEC